MGRDVFIFLVSLLQSLQRPSEEDAVVILADGETETLKGEMLLARGRAGARIARVCDMQAVP